MDYSVLERVWALPTFEIHGIQGGFVGEGAKTVIPAQATAKVSLRLVPGLEFEKVARQLGRRWHDSRRSGPTSRSAYCTAATRFRWTWTAPAFDLLDRGIRGSRSGERPSTRGPAAPSPSCLSSGSPGRR